MRRALRWFFAVTGTLVCLVAIVFWVRSYSVAPTITLIEDRIDREERLWFVQANYGRLTATYIRLTNAPPEEFPNRGWDYTEDRSGPNVFYFYDPLFDRAGFSLGSQDAPLAVGVRMQAKGFSLPLWFLALTGAGVASAAAWRFYRTLRAARAPTLCKSCGYDLRTGHDKCPECGAESTVPILKHVKVEPRRL